MCYNKISMQSIKNEERVTCPNGCEPFEIEYWSFIDASKNNDLKEMLLGGELNLFRCPSCQTFFHHDANIVYFDAPAELLVFVFSEKEKEKEKELVAKMQEDYQTLKNSVFKELHIDYQPIYVFGLEGLKEVLAAEEALHFESEVVAAAAASAGLKLVRLKPSYAREKGFPLYVAQGTDSTAQGYALSAGKVLSTGIHSGRLQNFKDKMSEGKVETPLIL